MQSPPHTLFVIFPAKLKFPILDAGSDYLDINSSRCYWIRCQQALQYVISASLVTQPHAKEVLKGRKTGVYMFFFPTHQFTVWGNYY
jgi:hypothetical protein